VRKQNPPKSSKFTICLTPSRKYQAEATATALNELGKVLPSLAHGNVDHPLPEQKIW
jgi:hypothetical protein